MLALYRSGRQADALAAYRNARHILVEQLGIEPSRELRDLERDILAQSITSPGAGGPPRATGEPRGPAAVRRRIPAPPTSFVGRGRELSEVAASVLSPGTRLLTLTGAGGSGKTRLALRVADAVAERFPDGACFVAFADISDATLIYATIGDALGQLDRTGAIPADRVHERLRDLHMLLVLDNLEHLALGAETLSGLLAACPSVKLLVTSREPLHLAAERQYQVPGLNGDDAVELFIDRAHAVARGRQIDATIARRICERLDFLPLAIELAAARVKALSPREVLSRLDARLPWLTGGPRDAPQRQRTLRATIQWSYELLDSEEQQLFARLGVFAGGCTLEAAERVCGARLDTVQALVDRSLLATDQHERYRMLETIREYALERLEQAGEADRLRRLHHEYFAGMIDAEQIFAPPRNWPPRASSVLAREQKNIRAALSWALRHKKWSGWRRL
jgi:predicted ATPase